MVPRCALTASLPRRAQDVAALLATLGLLIGLLPRTPHLMHLLRARLHTFLNAPRRPQVRAGARVCIIRHPWIKEAPRKWWAVGSARVLGRLVYRRHSKQTNAQSRPRRTRARVVAPANQRFRGAILAATAGSNGRSNDRGWVCMGLCGTCSRREESCTSRSAGGARAQMRHATVSSKKARGAPSIC